MNKKGQFYLLAAIIIIIAIFSLYTIRNYVKTEPEERTVYDLKNELTFETGKVVDFSIYSKSDTNRVIENWTDLYVKANQGKEIENFVFVYGNGTLLNVVSFNRSSAGGVSINIGDEEWTLDQVYPTKSQKKISFEKAVESITVKIEGIDYDFNLKEGENFIFLIKKQGYLSQG